MSHYIDLNQISYKEIKREVGSSGIEEIQSLLRWLRIRLPNREWEGRIAPSIISRSECELFGLSMPRFAFRLYLDSNHASFINIRRLGTMCAQSRAWGRRRPDSAQWRQIPFIQEVQPRGHPAWVLCKNVCIADCLLQMPEQVLRFNSDGTAKDITTDRLHVLTTHLGGAYGEREGVRGTPFARNMPLVGL